MTRTIFIALAIILFGSADLAFAQATEVEASEADPSHPMHILLSAGYLTSPGANGANAALGLRYQMGPYLSLGFDMGYGLMDASPPNSDHSIQDRWWMIPTVAFTLPTRPVSFEFGAGFGLGTASGFANWDTFIAAPADHGWAFQAIPTVRLHAMASTALSNDVDAFMSLELASLILDGGSFGWRDGNANPSVRDTTWMALNVGFAFGVF